MNAMGEDRDGKISKELETLTRINEVAKKLNSTLELSQIIKHTISELPAFLTAGKCSIFLYDPDREELVMAAHNHYDLDRKMDIRISIHDNSIINHAVRKGHSLLIKDIEKEFGLKNRSKYKSKSSMITLLKSGDKLLGIININDKQDSEDFNDWDLAIAENINEHLATAISNAQLFAQTRRLSITDGLTGLYTHRYFQEILERELARARRYGLPLSLIMIDIDHFKKVNDTYGHQAGDCVLNSLAAMTRRTLRRSDYACRYGGEEFSVVLCETDAEAAMITANRLLAAIRETEVPFNKEILKVTASLGLCTMVEGLSKTRMVEIADRALYRAKREGRDRAVVGTPEGNGSEA